MTAILLLSLLISCLAGALSGWAGGVGGRWTLRARLLDLERFAEALDRRVKGREGQAGQAVRQAQKSKEQLELEALHQAALRGPRRALATVEGDVGSSDEAHRAFSSREK